jgi:hypothetical protein
MNNFDFKKYFLCNKYKMPQHIRTNMSGHIRNNAKQMKEKINSTTGEHSGGSPCSQYLLRLPENPTKEEIMGQLERMIHQWDDSAQPESAQGYHRDALWLEEVRHIVETQDKEIGTLRIKLEDMADEARVASERE